MGTALTVIIPEGIRALYSDIIEKGHHHHKAIDRVVGATTTPESHEEEDVEHSSTIGLSLVLGKTIRHFFWTVQSDRVSLLLAFRYRFRFHDVGRSNINPS